MIERPIKKVATESYLYSFKDEDGSYNHSLDEEMQRVESAASVAIEQLSAMVNDVIRTRRAAVPIADSLVNSIMELLYWQIKRHPDMIAEIELECKRWCLDKGYSPERAKAMALKSVKQLGRGGECDIRREFEKKNKLIIFTLKPEAHFITSDRPFVRFNKTGKDGISVEGTEMYYPITSSMLLFMCGNGQRKEMHPERSRPWLRTFNTHMAKSARRYLFGKSDRYLRRVVRNLRRGQADTGA